MGVHPGCTLHVWQRPTSHGGREMHRNGGLTGHAPQATTTSKGESRAAVLVPQVCSSICAASPGEAALPHGCCAARTAKCQRTADQGACHCAHSCSVTEAGLEPGPSQSPGSQVLPARALRTRQRTSDGTGASSRAGETGAAVPEAGAGGEACHGDVQISATPGPASVQPLRAKSSTVRGTEGREGTCAPASPQPALRSSARCPA